MRLHRVLVAFFFSVAACSGGGDASIDPDAGFTPVPTTTTTAPKRPPSCTNGLKDDNEADQDCGGACILKCFDGKACGSNGDCASGSCVNNRCAGASCTDGARNGQETDVDCGGSCPSKCANSKACKTANDCQSAICTTNVCVGPSCIDGKLNGGETGIDCGGPCGKCTIGKACKVDDDCVTNACNGTTCIAKATFTGVSPQCLGTTGGTQVTLSGTGFINKASTVSFGATSVTGTFSSATTLLATAPAGTAGKVDVTILGQPGGALTLSQIVSYTAGTFTTLLFATPQSVGYSSSGAIALGDLSGDGKMDFAEDHSGSHIDLGINNGNGTYNTVTSITGSSLRRMVFGDVTGDGKSDLVVTTGNLVGVYPSTGTTLGTRATYTAGLTPEGIAIADFNGDLKLDIAVIHSGADAVGIFLNTGAGTFDPMVTVAAPRCTRIVAADFNADGKIDLATSASVASQVTVLLGNGNGTFQTAVAYALSGPSAGLTIGDFDGDLKIDLAAATGSKVSVLGGKGDGTFNVAVDTTIPGANAAQVLAATDFDADGKAEVVILNQAAARAEIWTTCEGVFTTNKSFSVGSPTDLWLADMNGDGKTDVVTSGSEGPRLNHRQ